MNSLATDRRALLALIAAWALHAGHFFYVCDDAYISFRVARNLVEGHGLVYNLGVPPVEAHSNVLWVLVAALGLVVGLSPALFTAGLSLACGGVLVWRVGRRSLAAAAMLALSPAIAVWSTSGLETLPFALLAWLGFEGLEQDRRWAGPVLLALSLTRLEGIVWSLLLLALRFRRHAAPWLLGWAAVLAWRVGFYGPHVGNTAQVKVGLRPDAVLRGGKYVAWNLLALWTPLLAIGGLRLDRASALALASLAAAVLVGGDFMPFGRLLVVGLPFLALAFARLPRAVQLIGLVLGLLPSAGIQHTAKGLWFRMPDQAPFSERVMWERERDQVLVLQEVGRMLQGAESLSAGAIGAVGWTSRIPLIHDRYGLVSPEVAQRQVETLVMPGHDKRVPPFFFADQRPEVLFAAFVDPALVPSFDEDLRKAGLDGVYETGFLVEGERRLFVIRRREPPKETP